MEITGASELDSATKGGHEAAPLHHRRRDGQADESKPQYARQGEPRKEERGRNERERSDDEGDEPGPGRRPYPECQAGGVGEGKRERRCR